MKAGGSSLKDFLINLPNFHSRVMLMYPNITPPEFKVTDMEESNLNLHYYSTREGLSDFVVGLLQGLSILFDTKAQITIVESRDKGDDHEVFNINWGVES